MKKLTKAILVAILVLAAGCETFKEPQDDTVWFDLNVVGYPCVTLGGQQIIDSGDMYGLQVAPIGTVSENLGGAQVGLFNFAGGGGLQIGLFNRVHGDWRGVQIGVVNWIDDGWILPLVNWRFRQSTSKYTESIKKGNR